MTALVVVVVIVITTAMASLLTQDSFVDLQNYHLRNERAAIETSLDTFLQIYDENKKEIVDYIKSGEHEDSSKNFMSAIRFLRHFKGHYRELDILDPEDRKTLTSEVIGLMASILQAVMNVKHLDRYLQVYMREIFLGNELRSCLNEGALYSAGDFFVYSFPKLFIGKEIIKGNWFTSESAQEKAELDLSLVERDCYNMVIGYFVKLYDNNLKASFGSATYELAVMKLRE